MDISTQEMLDGIFNIKNIGGGAAFAFIIWLAKVTDALRKLYDFVKSISNKIKGRGKPDIDKRRQFEKIRKAILHCALVNNIPVELRILRDFILDNDFVESPNVKRFFEKWLCSIPVIVGRPMANPFSDENLKQLVDDLMKIEL